MNYIYVKRSWLALRITYALVPILVGLDKLFMANLIVDWAKYVSPLLMSYVPLTVDYFLIAVGLIEIAAGLLVWFRPYIGGYIVSLWMDIIIIDLVSINMFYDIIARDAVIAIGALALAWLTKAIKE